MTGISVRTKVFGWAFLLLLFKTTVVIDGVEQVLPWGEHLFNTTPGEHEVRVSFRYLGVPDVGENSIQVTVTDGNIVQVNYRSPFLPFLMKGRIRLVE